jgi:hypothetical protein
MGKCFDESFLKSIEKLPNASYIAPLMNESLVLNDIKAESHNALHIPKADFLSNSIPILTAYKIFANALKCMNCPLTYTTQYINYLKIALFAVCQT